MGLKGINLIKLIAVLLVNSNAAFLIFKKM